MFVSTHCAIRYKTCQHFYHCHLWCHELFVAYAKFGSIYYAKLNEIQKTEFHFALEVSFSIHIQLHTVQNLIKT